MQGQQAAVAAALAELQSDSRLAALARQTESWQEEAAQKQQHSDALEDAQLTILKFQKAADVAKYDAEQKVADATCKNALAMEKAIHLAAQAGVRYSLENPFVYAASNLVGHLSILELVRQSPKQPLLVYASSSSVYGANTKVPFSESDPVNSPVSLYAATKRARKIDRCLGRCLA